jgi:hypothetical protein
MRVHYLLLAVAVVASSGCDDAVLPSALGSLRVSIATTGGDLDEDGYGLTVDGGPAQSVSVSASTLLNDLDPGPHTLELGGIAHNCTAAGDNPRTVTVVADETVTVDFAVSCVATGFQISAPSSGPDLDPDGYRVTVDGGQETTLPTNGRVFITRLDPGTHTIALSHVADHCTLEGENPRAITIADGETAQVAFTVTCVATKGAVAVTAATSGLDAPSVGYRVRVDDRPERGLALNGTVVILGLSAGDHSVTIGGVPTNCAIVGDNPRTVTVSVGGATRDTARTTAELTCEAIWHLAYSRHVPGYYYANVARVAVTSADGLDTTSITWGDEPDWSPDGRRIVFTGCDDYYYAYDCGIAVMNANGTELARLTDNSTDNHGTWSPDGAKIAFTRMQRTGRTGRRLPFLMNADGSGAAAVLLPATVQSSAHPAWSPDGATLAFTCRIATDNDDICIVRPDGTGFTRLTSDPVHDARPSWHPDGSRIAFTTSRFGGSSEIAVMNADGSDVQRLAPGTSAIHPAWSHDGTKIAFTQFVCDIYAGCTILGLSVMNADGTGLTRLTTGDDHAPVWRP